MDGDGRHDDGDRGVLSQDHNIDCNNDRQKGRQRGMGVGLGEHSIGDQGYLADKGVCEEETGNNHTVCRRDTDIQFFTGAERVEGFSRFLGWCY